MRRELRVIGIDDGPFDKFKVKSTLLVGTYFRGGQVLDGILSTKVRIDGANANLKIADMVNSSKFKKDLRAILLGGITVGGFNIIDIIKLYHATHVPIIVFLRKRPNITKFKATLRNLGMEKKTLAVDHAGPLHKVNNNFYQYAGITAEEAAQIISLTTTNAEIPEPLRLAHIIAAGIVRGESYGNA
ncbi:DUF99 family protein [Candidatus Woesearchaeota archaeon]|nr:DUF99 family protein [Candidatus Woesearchaeota archaeon]